MQAQKNPCGDVVECLICSCFECVLSLFWPSVTSHCENSSLAFNEVLRKIFESLTQKVKNVQTPRIARMPRINRELRMKKNEASERTFPNEFNLCSS